MARRWQKIKVNVLSLSSLTKSQRLTNLGLLGAAQQVLLLLPTLLNHSSRRHSSGRALFFLTHTTVCVCGAEPPADTQLSPLYSPQQPVGRVGVCGRSRHALKWVGWVIAKLWHTHTHTHTHTTPGQYLWGCWSRINTQISSHTLSSLSVLLCLLLLCCTRKLAATGWLWPAVRLLACLALGHHFTQDLPNYNWWFRGRAKGFLRRPNSPPPPPISKRYGLLLSSSFYYMWLSISLDTCGSLSLSKHVGSQFLTCGSLYLSIYVGSPTI